MTRKLVLPFIATLMLSLFVISPVLAAKTYYAERFDVQIDLQEDGSAVVTETVVFHFQGGDFTYAFREVSATETDGVTFLQASMDGTPMSQGTQAGQVEVEAGDPLKVTWHFLPTSDASHVFLVRYRADGVVRKGDADALIWRAIPQDHDYIIQHSTITLTYPARATLLETPALSRDYEPVSTEDHIILTQSGLAEDEDLILTAKFAPGSLIQVAPQWQTRQERTDAATARVLPIGFGAAILTLVFGGFGLFSYIRANGRELNISPVISTANPPSDLPPAVVGKLTGQQHNSMGAIFDLAQRGVLDVREEKGFWASKRHVLVRKDYSILLKPYEQGLMDTLFKPGETQINMEEIGMRMGVKNGRLFDEPLEKELIQRGWLDTERKQKRTAVLIAGMVVLILSMAVFLFSLLAGGISLSQNAEWTALFFALAGIGAGLFILSIAIMVYGATYSVLTPAGEEQSARWKGFAEYLRQVSKGREPAIRPDYFERYLAYAAVFALGAKWAQYFEKLGGVPLPIWFHAMAGGPADFGGMVAVMSASDSSGAGAGGAGGGASGGGSSGAG